MRLMHERYYASLSNEEYESFKRNDMINEGTWMSGSILADYFFRRHLFLSQEEREIVVRISAFPIDEIIYDPDNQVDDEHCRRNVCALPFERLEVIHDPKALVSEKPLILEYDLNGYPITHRFNDFSTGLGMAMTDNFLPQVIGRSLPAATEYVYPQTRDSNLRRLKYPHDKVYPLGNNCIATTREYPLVMAFDGLGDCTGLFSFNGEGDALFRHRRMINYTDDDIRAETQLFTKTAERYLGKDRLTLITGTNIAGEGRDDMILKIMECLNEKDIELLIARQSHDQSVYTELPTLIDYIKGGFFVPRYLSITGRNEYYIANMTEGHQAITSMLSRP
ncbi:MAG: hypothetical protein NDI94_01580 [Candidatus Woesearchaeota archaeon]|nr:hypothetical protein [Candidatus Woesearchaeota archaeon]